MKKLINSILVPFDVAHPPHQAVEQAIQMANHFQCDFHILLIDDATLVPAVAQGRFFSSRRTTTEAGNTEKINWVKQQYAHRLEERLSFHVSDCNGPAEQMILEYTILNQVDLVVIGKSGKTMLGRLFYSLGINRLARKTKSAILVIREKPELVRIKNIVLPVSECLPVRKIMFASYLARMFNSKIHVIALGDRFHESSGEKTLYLYKTYELLRQNTNLYLECHTVPGENIADATLDYARKVKADLIVVNPGKELLLSGFIDRLFARFITNESGIPVMTIAPAQPV